mmetsp:Transcript_2311/g.2639  ORF Transcript_2311/g.2639 Transcript_2311/m.2639 type:complete len:765 (+) Transcript_2311:103-2397(+)
MDLGEALLQTATDEQYEVFEELYNEVAEHPDGLTKDELCSKLFGLETGYFSDRVFDLFDADHAGRVSKDEFILGMSSLVSRDAEAFVDFLFDVFDVDDSNRLDEDEIYQGILASMRANKLSLAVRIEDFFNGSGKLEHQNDEHKRAKELARSILDAAGPGEHVEITREEFKRVFREHTKELSNLASPLTKTRIATQKFKQYLSSNGPVQKMSNSAQMWKIQKYIRKNRRELFFTSLWMFINLCLFLGNFLYYRFEKTDIFDLLGYCICFARGSALAIQFNVTIVLLTMARSFLTAVRNLNDGAILNYMNLDSNVKAHKICGLAILVLALIHTFAHVCDFHRLGQASVDELNQVLNLDEDFTNITKPSTMDFWISSWPGVTGILMLICFAIAYPGVLNFLRRNGNFNLFWGTHQMLIVFCVIVMIHGYQRLLGAYTAFYWIIGPFTLYISDRIKRMLQCRSGHSVIETEFLEPNVMAMKIEKNGMRFKPGQYIFLKVNKISPFEWHPFTLTCTPEDNFLSVHVRNAGSWTNALHKLYLETEDDVEKDRTRLPEGLPEIYIDGPYGAPSQAYERYKVNVFVAAGIGVTPYASILAHILNNVRRIRESFSNEIEAPSHYGLPVQKVYLIWVTRDEHSFVWFQKLLQDFYRLDVNEMIEIHHYYSKAYQKGDIRNAMVVVAQEIEGKKQRYIQHGEKQIPLNRSRYYSHYGRPDWGTILPGIKEACRSIDHKCGIFATVPPRFSAALKAAALSSSDKDFTFDYSNENF